MKIKFLFLSLLMVISAAVNAQELPENAEPGKCYIKCITADKFSTETETIQVAPAYKKLRAIPATYKTETERVLVKEATVKKIYVPAVFETVTVEVPSAGDAVNYKVVPASFGESSKTIEVSPKYGKWDYTELADCPSANKEDCMVACFIETPARSITVPITTLNEDAKVLEVKNPLPGSTYKKQVIKVPAKVIDEPIPAQYATIKKQVVDVPAKVLEETVPAVTKTITKTKLVEKGGITVWEEVDCKLVGSSNILPIQYELNSARITPASASIIDNNLLKLMNEKPALRIEIMSFTDSRGNDAYNMSLSQQRAQAVVNYLVNKGISRNRMIARGYGETRLKNNCKNGVPCSEDQHQQNRRTEFRIISQ